jgi:methylphosphotriester-DNA--protein-cysteine methyltransferase
MNDGGTSGERRLAVEIAQPAEPLRRFISAYFVSEADLPEAVVDLSVPEWGAIRFVHDGSFNFNFEPNEVVVVDRPYLQGPTSKAFRFSLMKSRILGVGLLPEGFARFWDLDLAKIANNWAWTQDVFGADMATLAVDAAAAPSAGAQFALADAYFLGLLEKTRHTHASSQTAQLHKFLNDPEISRLEVLADAMHLSHSALTMLCKKRFGFPPKLLLRRQRFLRMLEALHARPYSEWPHFVDPQYADQSHMIRDFRYFMGMSPGQYLAQPRQVQQQSALQRTAAVGRALQGLD